MNIRDLTSNTGEYLSREVFSEKRYNIEKENYDKFLLTECFKDLISDNILEKFDEKENYINKEEIENIIDEIPKEKEQLKESNYKEKEVRTVSKSDFEEIEKSDEVEFGM